MNYFSFFEILRGTAAFLISGVISAFLSESLELILLSKDALFLFVKHLYHNRSKIFGREAFCMKFLQIESRVVKHFLDFVSVFILFIGYILSSYVCFEGVFRLVYLFPLLFSYYLSHCYLMTGYRRAFLLVIRSFLAFLSTVFAVPIFLLNQFFRVLMLPFLCIIYFTRWITIRMISPMLKRRWLEGLRKETGYALEAETITK